MKNVLRALLLALMLLGMVLLVPSGVLVGQAEIIELPLNAKADELIEPYAACFLSEWEYEDPSISVKIEEGRIYDTTYLVAHIKIANATQIRAALSGNYSSNYCNNTAKHDKSLDKVVYSSCHVTAKDYVNSGKDCHADYTPFVVNIKGKSKKGRKSLVQRSCIWNKENKCNCSSGYAE